MEKKPRTVSADQIAREVDPSPEERHLKSKVSELEGRIEELKKDYGGVRVLFQDIRNAIEICDPVPIVYTPPKGKMIISSPCASALQCSDWHIGKYVKADQIEEWNEFSFEIASQRVQSLVQRKTETVEIERSSAQIDDLHILSTGDMINGNLRPGDTATNEFPICIQPVKAGYLWADMLMGFAPHFRHIYVHWVVPDNHGRLTPKIETAEPWNSMNYIVAEIAKAKTAAQENIKWDIFPGELGIANVLNRAYLLRHAHDIGQSSLGIQFYAFERSVGREARRRMNRHTKYHFNILVTGHFHAPARTKDWWIGGSLSGTDNYDNSMGRESGPLQTGWLVHPKRGEMNYNEYDLSTR